MIENFLTSADATNMQANNVTNKHDNPFDIRNKILLSVSVYFLALKIGCILFLYQLSNEAKPPLSTPMTHVNCSYSQNIKFFEWQIFSQMYEWFCVSHFHYSKILFLKNKLWFYIEAIQCCSVTEKRITIKTFSTWLIWFVFEALIPLFVTMMMG